MTRILINGRMVHMPDTHATDEDIRRMGNIDSERNLLQRTREGNVLIPRGSRIDVHSGDAFVDAPARVKG